MQKDNFSCLDCRLKPWDCARRLSFGLVDLVLNKPLLACRLIAVDKNSGVRPIGINDIAQCIISTSLLRVIKADIQEVAGCVQLCGGQPAGIEACLRKA